MKIEDCGIGSIVLLTIEGEEVFGEVLNVDRENETMYVKYMNPINYNWYDRTFKNDKLKPVKIDKFKT